jgi:cyclase
VTASKKELNELLEFAVALARGAGKLEHFYEALTDGGASAVLAASLFHFGEFTIAQVKNYLRSRNVEVR